MYVCLSVHQLIQSFDTFQQNMRGSQRCLLIIMEWYSSFFCFGLRTHMYTYQSILILVWKVASFSIVLNNERQIRIPNVTLLDLFR
jgi:hypothetical protein